MGGLAWPNNAQEPEIIAGRSNEILTAVVQGARKEEQSTEVQASALQALYNSLEFIRDNFDREVSRTICKQIDWANHVRGNATISCKSSARPPKAPISECRSWRISRLSALCICTMTT